MAQPERASSATGAVLALPDAAATARLAAHIASLARPGDVIGLAGDLGAGKTAFARAFIAALAPHETEVPSPTFTLVQGYTVPSGTVWHFDLYRIATPEEAWELGIEEAFAGGISLIEWPEKLGPLMPGDSLVLSFATVPGGPEEAREIALAAGPAWHERLAALLAEWDPGAGD